MSPPVNRSKTRQNSDVCADCGATDPCWVSVNRAILICTECCLIHRSLGRHISQIKSLDKSLWPPTQLAMIMALNNSGVNNIWEHTLLDPNLRPSQKKTPSKDTLHSAKIEFIRLKHSRLHWAIRGPKSEGLNDVPSELGQQLHASARSSNLHTSARLLVQGADPNYFHDEKGSTPLHVAAKSNQVLQAELLLVYGADPGVPDANGRTSIEAARQAGNIDLADRLLEATYELTDRLSYFLCSQRPDHKAGQHLLVPDVKEIDATVIGRSKLNLLSNRLFEDFAIDIFDEVDRREIETIWQNTPGALDYGSVPFLPVQPNLSSTRNQARQKLARLEAREFNAVVLDVLNDARRRQYLSRFNGVPGPIPNLLKKEEPRQSQVSDDEPLYDSVASDDDYAALTPIVITEKKPLNVTSQASSKTEVDSVVNRSKTLAELKEEINTLRGLVERLSLENCDLRSKLNTCGDVLLPNTTESTIENSSVEAKVSDTNLLLVNNQNGHSFDMEPVQDVKQIGYKTSQRPASMYEARDRDWQTVKNQEASRPGMTQSLYQSPSDSLSSHSLFEIISRRTNQVTKRIQELWVCIQGASRHDKAIPCAEKIRVAVAELTAVIPQNQYDDVVKTAIRQMITGTARLQVECAGLQRACSLSQQSQTLTYLHLVRTCAYDIAKATKILITKFQDQC